eukprot:TRINITY_DN10369_c0_g1_i2.p1 TRINITY_DN10369_c0_g1~~TRINITY_DN10369_c0_g1_i2.p1  ORF type:complete len:498 (+),score=85.91 TRINITY_DN10369_c0_g1_i2:29-1495(+)
MATSFLSKPDVKYLGDNADLPEQHHRATAKFETFSERFKLPKSRSYEKQYSNLYFSRYMSVRQRIIESAKSKWNLDQDGHPVLVDEILKMQKGVKCAIFGTIYKDMKLKPSILDEHHARENYEAPPPERSKYNSEDDGLVLEDQSGRIAIVGPDLAGTLVTGVIMALLGQENDQGEFEVEDTCHMILPPNPPLPQRDDDSYVCFVSGLNLDARAKNLFALELFVDVITGQLGSRQQQRQMSQVVKVVMAGNLIRASTGAQDNLAQYKRRNLEPETVEHMREVDLILSQLACNVPVDLMPGEHDPSNKIIPQQPLHPCMFPLAAKYDSLKGVTNPCDFGVDGVRFLGTSGQNVDDVYRYTTSESRISILQNILEWGHLFPTAPDTTCIFPYTHEHRDPFVIADTPNVFFAGNQPTFETAEVQLDSGSSVRLVCVPSFSKTGTVVLVNLRTLECTPVTFGNTVATDHDENDVNGDNDDAMDQEEDTTEDS